MKNVCAAVAIFLLLPGLLYSQCDPKRDNRSNKQGGILINEMVVSGTQAIDSTELAGITGNFTDSCFNENKEEISERIVDQFQQRGYFMAKVDKLTIKPLDPLATPKPSKVEAEIIQGPLYRISEIQFTGNRGFSSAELKALLPIKLGDVFNTEKMRSGLKALGKLYGSHGYIDFTPIPGVPTSDSNGTVALRIDVEEGQQYRMGKLEIIGQSRNADLLKTKWELAEGALFDNNYIGKFLDEYSSLLPEGFNRYRSVFYSRNCKAQTVSLTFVLENRPDFKPPAEKVGCEAPAKEKAKS